MEFNEGHKLSKNQRRKARRYGKKTSVSSNLGNGTKCNTDLGLPQFIKSLLQIPSKEDHSLDELRIESGKRPWPLLPGSYEMGKRR